MFVYMNGLNEYVFIIFHVFVFSFGYVKSSVFRWAIMPGTERDINQY